MESVSVQIPFPQRYSFTKNADGIVVHDDETENIICKITICPNKNYGFAVDIEEKTFLVITVSADEYPISIKQMEIA